MPKEDAGWAGWFLAGNRIKGAMRTGELRRYGHPLSQASPLVDRGKSYERVGDLAETLSFNGTGKRKCPGISPSTGGRRMLFLWFLQIHWKKRRFYWGLG